MRYLFVLLASATLFLSSCKNTPEAAATQEAQPVAEAAGKTYTVVPTASKVLWTGSKPTGKHNGTFPVGEGTLTVENGMVTSGSFTLNMANLTVDDLTGDDKQSLETHLKGTGADGKEDFFNVTQFPTAKFEVTKVTGLANDKEGNALVYGNLTLLNVTKEVNFKANINIMDNNVTVSTPVFKINRTDWGLKYKSKSFEAVKDKFIDDEVELQVNLNAAIAQ